jgi:hypothetical protein
MLNFYQINKDDEIQTRDCMIIKILIPCHRTISTYKLKLLDEVLRYDLYYFLIYFLKRKLSDLETCIDLHYHVLNFYQINKNVEI